MPSYLLHSCRSLKHDDCSDVIHDSLTEQQGVQHGLCVRTEVVQNGWLSVGLNTVPSRMDAESSFLCSDSLSSFTLPSSAGCCLLLIECS
jgi:hypothetical protein